MTKINTVFCQRYLEADEFFGTKPDGFSVHTSMEALKDYSKPYVELNRGGDGVTYTDGQPYTVQAGQLPAELLEKLEASTGSVRVYKGQFAVPMPPKESGGLWEPIPGGGYGKKY